MQEPAEYNPPQAPLFDRSCKRCILHTTTRTVCIPGRGPLPADIMLVGEAPGAEEEKVGQPFVGPAGKILDGVITEVSLGPSIYITNAGAKCRPPGNRTPHKDEVRACQVFLGQELEAVQPKIIIALGTTAAEVLTGRSAIATNRGQLLPALAHWRTSAPVLITYHPAAILHQDGQGGPRIKAALVSDLKLAYAAVYGEASGSAQRGQVVVGHPYTQAGRLAIQQFAMTAALNPECALSCDLEWEVPVDIGKAGKGKSAMWPWGGNGQITAVGLALIVSPPPITDGLPHTKYEAAQPGQVLGISLPWERQWMPLIEPCLKHPLLYHNAIADLIWLLGRYGNVEEPVGDTLILASLLGYPSLGLKVLAPQVCGVRPGWGEEVPLGQKPATIAGWSKLLTYNAYDAAYTMLLHERLVSQMNRERPQVEVLYRHLLLPAVYHMAHGGLRGLPMDLPALQQMDQDAIRIITERSRELEQELGVPMRQKVKVAEAVERLTGARFSRTPKLGHPSLNTSELEQVDHPIAKALVGLAKMVKMETTYLGPWNRALSDREDHCLHTIYRVTGASTGRTSSESEAGGTVQQYPRGKKMRSLVRARPGWKIICADESMLEIRITAWMSREPRMLKFLQEGIDVHRATASWVKLNGQISLQDFVSSVRQYASPEVVPKDERQAAKPVNFGLIYGGGANIVVDIARKDYGVSMTLGEAEQAKRGFFELYPGLLPWHQSAWEWVRKGYVHTPFGLVRNLAGLNEPPDSIHRKAINTPVQGTASFISLLGMVGCCREIRRRGLQGVIQINDFVHDSILGTVRDDYVDEAIEIVRKAMEHPPLDLFGIDLDVPLIADIKVSETW